MISGRARRFERAIKILGWVFVGFCVVGLIIEAVAGVRQNWPAEVGLTVAIAMVSLALIKLRSAPSRLATALLTVGVVPAAVVQVWSVVIPLLALVVIVLAVLNVRDLPSAGQAGEHEAARGTPRI